MYNYVNARFMYVLLKGSSKSKKRRGKTKGLRLAKIRKEGERFDVLIPSHLNRAVGDFSTMFGTELGVIVRQCAPLQAVSWETIDDALKCWMITHIRVSAFSV